MQFDREKLMADAMLQEKPTPAEIASITSSGTPFFKLLGMLLREQQEQKNNAFLRMDLVSEDGLREAAKIQGIITGQMMQLERVFDLIGEHLATKDEK